MNPTYKEDKNKFYSYIDKQDIKSLKKFVNTYRKQYGSLVEAGFEYAMGEGLENVVDFYLKDTKNINVAIFRTVLHSGNETHFNKVSFFLSKIKQYSKMEQSSFLRSAVNGENLNIIKQMIECIDPAIGFGYLLWQCVENQYEEGMVFFIPLCEQYLDSVLENIQEYCNETTVSNFRSKIDAYYALQLQKRLNDELADTLDTKSNSKRKM